MARRTPLQSRIRKVRQRLEARLTRRRKQAAVLRARAADAALHWVMSHRQRVSAFRAAVRGTPVERALDHLLKLLRREARPRRRAARR